MHIIINPNNGPDSSEPNSAYQQCLPLIKTAGSNAILLGYVRTGFGDRAISDVESDVSLYADWDDAFRPNGIFFDEVPTSSSFVNQYASFASFARQNFDFVRTYIKLSS